MSTLHCSFAGKRSVRAARNCSIGEGVDKRFEFIACERFFVFHGGVSNATLSVLIAHATTEDVVAEIGPDPDPVLLQTKRRGWEEAAMRERVVSVWKRSLMTS